MTPRRTGFDQHNSPEEVEAYTREACDIADKIGLDAEDRAVLLPQILALVAGRQIFYEQAQALPNFAIPRNHRG